MPATLLALQVLLILLPGFAAAYLVQLFAVRGQQTDFDKVIEAALYSVVIYGLYLLTSHGTLPFSMVPAKPPATETTVVWQIGKLLALCGIVPIVAGAAVLYINKDGNRIVRKTGLTTRTTRRSVWNDIFECETQKDQVVQVELDGNRSLIGVLIYWSDSPEDSSIFVGQARWISQEGEQIEVKGAGVLLTKEAKIKSISLLDDPILNPPPAFQPNQLSATTSQQRPLSYLP